MFILCLERGSVSQYDFLYIVMCTRVMHGQGELMPWKGHCDFFVVETRMVTSWLTFCKPWIALQCRLTSVKHWGWTERSVNKGLDCQAVLNDIEQGTPLQCLIVDVAPSVESMINKRLWAAAFHDDMPHEPLYLAKTTRGCELHLLKTSSKVSLWPSSIIWCCKHDTIVLLNVSRWRHVTCRYGSGMHFCISLVCNELCTLVFLLRSLFQFRQPACCNCVCVEKIVVTSKFFSYCEAKAFLQMLCFSCYLYTFTTFSLLCCLLQQSSMRMNFYGLQIRVNVHFFLCTVDVVGHFFLPICYFCCSFFFSICLVNVQVYGLFSPAFFFFFRLAQHATFSRVLPTPEFQES